jgi:hypothetical protein
VSPLPSDTLRTLADFIEYSNMNVLVLEDTVAWIQIHNARVRNIVESNHNQSGTRIVVRLEIVGSVIDAAMIYAGAGAMMAYSRRQKKCLPQVVSWQEVRVGLINIGVWNDEHETLVKRREDDKESSGGAFGRLREEVPTVDLP